MDRANRGVIHSPGTDPRLAEGFIVIPVALMRSALDPGEKALYGILLSYSWNSGEAWPTQARLTRDMNRSERQVRMWLQRLEEVGLIHIHQQGLQKPNVYEIVSPLPDWLLSEEPPPDRKKTAGQDRQSPDRKETSGPARQEAAGQGQQEIAGQDQRETADKEDSVNSAVPPSEDKPKDTAPSGSGVPGSLEPEANTARTRARVNSARTRMKAPPNPDVRPLLLRHAQSYQDKVGAPYPIAWGKDGAIVKRLLATYGRDGLVLLQDTYFAQKADSQAALRGYTVQWLEHEAPALMARIKMHESLTDEQRQIVAALCAEGVAESTATAIAGERPIADILRQLRAHEARKDRLRNPAAALVKAIREGWEVQDEPAPAYYQPLKPAAASEGGQAGPPPEEVRLLMERTIAQLTGR